jgi:hypothetical protein
LVNKQKLWRSQAETKIMTKLQLHDSGAKQKQKLPKKTKTKTIGKRIS